MGTETPPSDGKQPHIVDMSLHFARAYDRLAANDPKVDSINQFIDHVETSGFSGLPGRIKKSDDINPNIPGWRAKIEYVRANNLWHYHMGYPCWDESRPPGDWTSQYVLHLMRHECGERTTIIHYSEHPPFKLPQPNFLWMT